MNMNEVVDKLLLQKLRNLSQFLYDHVPGMPHPDLLQSRLPPMTIVKSWIYVELAPHRAAIERYDVAYMKELAWLGFDQAAARIWMQAHPNFFEEHPVITNRIFLYLQFLIDVVDPKKSAVQ